MGWKCAPQIMGLVRGEPKPEQKHRANGLKICKEAGKERASKSKTVDRTRSKNNKYLREESGADCWAKMEEAASEYRVTGKSRSGKEFSRKLRGDAVIGWAMIFKPPEDVSQNWDEATKRKFRNDSWDVMRELEPRLFRKSNIRMIALHRDEGGDHAHFIGDAIDQNGKYCGSLIDFNLFQLVNDRYPAMMRARGWEMDDLEATDWKRYNSDPEYRAMVDAKKAGSGGLSVNDYSARQAAERAEAAAELYRDAVEAEQEAQKAREEAQKAREEAQQDREAVRAMLGDTRRIMGDGEAKGAEIARRRRQLPKLPGE